MFLYSRMLNKKLVGLNNDVVLSSLNTCKYANVKINLCTNFGFEIQCLSLLSKTLNNSKACPPYEYLRVISSLVANFGHKPHTVGQKLLNLFSMVIRLHSNNLYTSVVYKSRKTFQCLSK